MKRMRGHIALWLALAMLCSVALGAWADGFVPAEVAAEHDHEEPGEDCDHAEVEPEGWVEPVPDDPPAPEPTPEPDAPQPQPIPAAEPEPVAEPTPEEAQGAPELTTEPEPQPEPTPEAQDAPELTAEPELQPEPTPDIDPQAELESESEPVSEAGPELEPSEQEPQPEAPDADDCDDASALARVDPALMDYLAQVGTLFHEPEPPEVPEVDLPDIALVTPVEFEAEGAIALLAASDAAPMPGPEGIISKEKLFAPIGVTGTSKAAFYMLQDGQWVTDEVIWSGKNVQIDPTTGAWRAIKTGYAQITATAASNPTKTASHSFEIIPIEIDDITIRIPSVVPLGSSRRIVHSLTFRGLDDLYVRPNLYDDGDVFEPYKEIIWSSTGGIDLDLDAMMWAANGIGDASITATSAAQPNFSSTVPVQVIAPSDIQYIGPVSLNKSKIFVPFSNFILLLPDSTSYNLSKGEVELSFTNFEFISNDDDGYHIRPKDGVEIATITAALTSDPTNKLTVKLTIDPNMILTELKLLGDMPIEVGVGATGTLREVGNHPYLTWTHSESIELTEDEDDSGQWHWKATATGPAWICVENESDPDCQPAQWDFTVVESIDRIEFTEMIINGAPVPPPYPDQLPPHTTISATARGVDADNNPVDVDLKWSGAHIWYEDEPGEFRVHYTEESSSTIRAAWAGDLSKYAEWSFQATGLWGVGHRISVPRYMLVDEAFDLDRVEPFVMYMNTPPEQQDQRVRWSVSGNAVRINESNGVLTAVRAGDATVSITPLADTERPTHFTVTVRTRCCDDYRNCTGCSMSPTLHNTIYCSCHHNFPYYCPMCKGPCSKYLKADANGYFHAWVGSSVSDMGLVQGGEVRELRVPPGATANCCADPCPSCLLDPARCSGRDCTCDHAFPAHCPLCGGPCRAYRKANAGECHFVHPDGTVSRIALDPSREEPSQPGEDCIVCRSYRRAIIDNGVYKTIPVYAGGPACSCKPLFPAYCPICEGPCRHARDGVGVGLVHYLNYDREGIGLFKGAVCQFNRYVQPGEPDQEIIYTPVGNGDLFGDASIQSGFRSYLQSLGEGGGGDEEPPGGDEEPSGGDQPPGGGVQPPVIQPDPNPSQPGDPGGGGSSNDGGSSNGSTTAGGSDGTEASGTITIQIAGSVPRSIGAANLQQALAVAQTGDVIHISGQIDLAFPAHIRAGLSVSIVGDATGALRFLPESGGLIVVEDGGSLELGQIRLLSDPPEPGDPPPNYIRVERGGALILSDGALIEGRVDERTGGIAVMDGGLLAMNGGEAHGIHLSMLGTLTLNRASLAASRVFDLYNADAAARNIHIDPDAPSQLMKYML